MPYYGSHEAFERALTNTAEDALDLAHEYVGVLPNGHEAGIAATFVAAVRHLGAEGLDFLRIAALLAAAPVKLTMVSDVLRLVDALEPDRARETARRAFHQADQLCLAESVEAAAVPSRVVHQLLRRVLRFREAAEPRLAALRTACAQALSIRLRLADDIRGHVEIVDEIAHAREIVTASQDLHAVTLLAWIGTYELRGGAFRAAVESFEQGLALSTRLVGVATETTLHMRLQLAEASLAAGDFKRAREAFGKEHLNSLRAMMDLGSLLVKLDNLYEAQFLLETAHKGYRSLLGTEHPMTLSAVEALGEIMHKNGDFAGARRLRDDVFTRRRDSLGPDHPSTLGAMFNLAKTLHGLGELKEAKSLQKDVLGRHTRIFGSDHLHSITMSASLASMLSDEGEFLRARVAGTRREQASATLWQ